MGVVRKACFEMKQGTRVEMACLHSPDLSSGCPHVLLAFRGHCLSIRLMDWMSPGIDPVSRRGIVSFPGQFSKALPDRFLVRSVKCLIPGFMNWRPSADFRQHRRPLNKATYWGNPTLI